MWRLLIPSVLQEEGLICMLCGLWMLQTPEWSQSDICERCSSPFFWNFKGMWNQRAVGYRQVRHIEICIWPSRDKWTEYSVGLFFFILQHHCRKCGRAVCNECSNRESVLPIMGFEYSVRVCNDCFETITEEEWVLYILWNDQLL